MPRRAILRTILATMIGLAIWVPASAATAADPCCQVTVSGMPSQFRAGADPQFFNTTMSYNGSNGIRVRSVTATFTFAGQDLSSGQVQLARMRDGRWRSISVGRHNGKLSGIDTFAIDGGGASNGSITSQYRIAFGSHVHAQSVGMLLTMSGRLDNGHHTATQQLAQAGPFTMTVTAGAVTPTPTPTKAQAPTPTPTATPTPTVASQPSAAGGQSLGAAGAAATGSGSGGGAGGWIAYMIGGLLLIGGIGAIGTILWKRGQQGEPEWEQPYEPVAVPGGFGSPAAYGGGQEPATYGGGGGGGAHAYPQQQTYGNPAGYTAPTTAVPAHPPTESFHAVRPPIDPTRPMPRQ